MEGKVFIDADGDLLQVGAISDGTCYVSTEWPEQGRVTGAVLAVNQLRELRDHLTDAIAAYDASLATSGE